MDAKTGKGALAGGTLVAALALAAQLTGTLDKMGLASDDEIKDLPTIEEVQRMLDPLQRSIDQVAAEQRGMIDRIGGVETNLASLSGAWTEWKDNHRPD